MGALMLMAARPRSTSFVAPLALTLNPLSRAQSPRRRLVPPPVARASPLPSPPSPSPSSHLSSGRSRARKRSRASSRGNTRGSTSHSTRSRSPQGNDKWDRVQPWVRRTVFTEPPRTPSTSDLRPDSCPALVLNADFSPLSYMPLSLWPWQEVVKAVFLDRVTVVATYDVGVRSPGMLFPLPSVISLKQYQPVLNTKPAFTRFNVFLRDGFSCQYCGRRLPTHELTFDHVIPRCSGGRTNWKNVVTACIRCNHSKGRVMLHQLRGMKLKKEPKEPSNVFLQANACKFPPQYLHHTWRDYVYWSQSMQVEKDDVDMPED